MLTPQSFTPDSWLSLQAFTNARIALGRAGVSLPTRACLDFQLAHALARDAVNVALDFSLVADNLALAGFSSVCLQSQAVNQAMYLQRPDLGRFLCAESVRSLLFHASAVFDAVVVVADGLSSSAISHHAVDFLRLFLPVLLAKNYRIAPVCLVKHGRVAVGDAIAEPLGARLCIVLIGERPGLSSPDSLGIYFTYQARSGLSTDADRNCISNIHSRGLSFQEALHKLCFLIEESEKLGFSGVNLKDLSQDGVVLAESAQGNFLLDV